MFDAELQSLKGSCPPQSHRVAQPVPSPLSLQSATLHSSAVNMVRVPGIIPLLLYMSLSSASGINLGDLYGSGLSPGAEIYYVTDANYSQEVQPRFYDFEPPTFYGAIKPATAADVAHIVRTYVIPFCCSHHFC